MMLYKCLVCFTFSLKIFITPRKKVLCGNLRQIFANVVRTNIFACPGSKSFVYKKLLQKVLHRNSNSKM